MRYLPFVVTSALALTSGMNLLFAQHSGGHASSGHSSVSSGFHSRSSFPSSSSGVYPTTPTPIGLQHYFSNGVTGINPGALPTTPLRTGQYGGPYRIGTGHQYAGGRRYFTPYGYVPYFDPFFDYGSGFYNNGPDQDYGYGQPDPNAETANVTANLLGDQINRLSAEVEELQNERAQYAEPRYQAPRYSAPPMLPEEQTPSSAPLTLILRDGKQLQVKSYAVMGQQIWDFSAQPIRKIEISSINVEASRKASEASGAEFPDIR